MADFKVQRGAGPVWKFTPIGLSNQIWSDQNISEFGFTKDGISILTGSRATAEKIVAAIETDALVIEAAFPGHKP